MKTFTEIKNDFPIFQHHPKLVYLDSSASSLKPQVVIEAEREYYEQYGVNVHRGLYDLSVKATEMYEGAREKVRQFINAKSTKEIIFVRGATEGINLVANTWGQHLRPGDAIVLTEMEHHANILPWQALAKWIGVELRWIPVTENGELDLTHIDEVLLGAKFVAVTQMSNVFGTVNDVKLLAKKAHAAGAKILVDGAQSVPHMPVDVQDLDCDFLVFSGHKMGGPTGIGVVYAKQEVLEQMEPYQRGGDMILEVTKEGATWNELPWKFEAGTPNIAGAIGLGVAIEYLSLIRMEKIWEHEQELAKYGVEQIGKLGGVTMLGVPTSPLRRPSSIEEGIGESGRGAIFSFIIDGIHPHDIASMLNERGIAVRAGHHCAMPLHAKLGIVASTRASCYVYTTKEDIDVLVQGIQDIQQTFV